MSSVTKKTLMRVLPSVLDNDAGMHDLGETAAEALTHLWAHVGLPRIYTRIDELPEELLDILAKDFKVDWYDYNYILETKRALIKDNFFIHKHLGTVAAVKRALTDVWPPSTVEEWFEYDGDPYYFRVILDASGSQEPIRVDSALNAVHFYKPARAHLQDDIPIVRVSFGIVVQTSKDGMKYHVGICGTNPRVATHGDRSDEQIVIEDMARSEAYHSPVTGQMIAGTHPSIATHGQMENDGLLVGASASESTYTARPCGTSLNSLM